MRDRSIPLHNLGFLLALAILGAIGLQTYRTERALLEADASLRRSLEVVTAVQATLSALQDIETGMRGFVITGDPSFLEPYEKGRRDAALRRVELARMVAGRPDRVLWKRMTDVAIDRRIALAEAAVQALRTQGREAAAERVRVGGGKEAMDDVRALLDDLEQDERASLAALHAEVSAKAERSSRLAVAGGLGALVLLLTALWAVNRSLRERARALQQARAATARQAAMLQAIPDRLWQLDDDGHMHALRPVQVPMPPGIERRLRALAPDVGTDGMRSFEAQDGDESFEVRAVAAGSGHLAIVRDITEASRARRALDAQRRFLRTIVDTDENLIAVRDADGRYALCNVAYCDFLRLDPAHMEGRLPEELHGHAALKPLLRGDETVLGGEAEWRADRVQATDAQGQVRWLQVLKRPVERADGALQVLTVAVDVTASLRAERLKNEFVSTVSHELRTPLTSIRGALSMLRSGIAGDVPEGARPLVEIADKNTERLVRLINDILDIEKLEAGRLQLQTRVLDARALVAQALEQIGPYAREFGVALRLHGGDDAPVDVDPDRFAQVMANLLSNAIKHSPRDGEVEVRLHAVDGGIEIGVRDHGPGIPVDFQPRVFERFAQADASDARLRGGTGLGLAITRSLVEQMGGSIGFTSPPGEGTDFRTWWPRAQVSERAMGAGDGATATAGAARIVLLTADATTARELAAMIEPHGYAVEVASDAAQARRLLGGEDVRGVGIDLALAGEAGPAFLRELRAQARYRHLPALLLGVRAEDTLQGGAVGVVDWLSKPLEPSRVAEAVRGCLQGGPRARPDVLHVEDDPDVRTVVARLLAREPLQLHQAATLAEAREALAARRHDLLILDLMLPDGDGAELLPELGAARPPVPAIIFSAQDMDLPESRAVLHRLVKSRSDARQLAALIVENLKHWPANGPRDEDAG